MRIGFYPKNGMDSFVPTQQFQEFLEYCDETEDSKYETDILISAFPIPCKFVMRRVGNKYKIEFFNFWKAEEYGYEDREIDWFELGDDFNVWAKDDCYYGNISSDSSRLK